MDRHDIAIKLNQELEDRQAAGSFSDLADSLHGWRLRRALGRFHSAEMPTGATQLFERMCRESVSFPLGEVPLDMLIAEIIEQTGLPCRYAGDERLRTVDVLSLSQHQGVIQALQDFADGPLFEWAIDDRGVVIYPSWSETDLSLDGPEYQIRRLYDLRECFDRPDSFDASECRRLLRKLSLPYQPKNAPPKHIALFCGRWLVLHADAKTHLLVEATIELWESSLPDVPLYSPQGRATSLTTDAPPHTQAVLYNLTDLLDAQEQLLPPNDDPDGGPWPRPLRVFDLIEQCSWVVDPDSWSHNAGPGSIESYGSRLLVTQTPKNHEEIRRFLTSLRQRSGRAESLVARRDFPYNWPPLRWHTYDTAELWQHPAADPVVLKVLLESKLQSLLLEGDTTRPLLRSQVWIAPGYIVICARDEGHAAIESWLSALVEDRAATTDFLRALESPTLD